MILGISTFVATVMLGLSWDNVQHSGNEDNEDIFAFFLILIPMLALLAIPTSAKLVVKCCKDRCGIDLIPMMDGVAAKAAGGARHISKSVILSRNSLTGRKSRGNSSGSEASLEIPAGGMTSEDDDAYAGSSGGALPKRRATEEGGGSTEPERPPAAMV